MNAVKDHGVLLRSELPTRAISLHAPWAWALMFGGKDVENRSENFPRRHRGEAVLGRVWVHASLWPGPGPLRIDTNRMEDFTDDMEDMAHTAFQAGRAVIPDRELLSKVAALRGHVVGSIYVEGYQPPEDPPYSPWYVPGSLAILVRDPRPLAKPVPAKGALGWWTPSPDVMALLKEAA